MSLNGFRMGLGLRSMRSASFSSLRSGGLRKLKSGGSLSSSKLPAKNGSSISRSFIKSKVSEILSSDGSDVSSKVNSGLTKEYAGALEDQAKKDAADGVYEKDGKASALRDAQMEKYVSPDRDKAIAQASKLLTGGTVVSTTVRLSGLPYTASITKGRSGTTAELYDENGERFARYDSKNGKWETVATKAETQFKTASRSIYDKAYRAAQSKTDGGASSRLDLRI